jgi:hypothetical protein
LFVLLDYPVRVPLVAVHGKQYPALISPSALGSSHGIIEGVFAFYGGTVVDDH